MKLFQRILPKRARDRLDTGNQSELESHDRQAYIATRYSELKGEGPPACRMKDRAYHERKQDQEYIEAEPNRSSDYQFHRPTLSLSEHLTRDFHFDFLAAFDCPPSRLRGSLF